MTKDPVRKRRVFVFCGGPVSISDLGSSQRLRASAATTTTTAMTIAIKTMTAIIDKHAIVDK